MAIKFHFQTKTALRKRQYLKSFITGMCKAEGRKTANIDFIFCDNPYLLDMNKKFLKHDYYTDIITFDLSESVEADLSGEIYISSDMVATNAKAYQIDFSNELHRVIFHGVLHLCGYNDKNSKQKKEMTSKEDFYLKGYFSKI